MYYEYACIEELIGVANSCEDQTAVKFWLDQYGIGLEDAANIADNKFQTGRNLVNQKIKQAVHLVISELTINTYSDDDTICDIDDLVCENSVKIAEAVYYKAAALIYQEAKLGTNKFNEYIKYSEDKIDLNLLLLDSSFSLIWTLSGGDGRPPSGLFQLEMQKLKPLQKRIERMCIKECKGARNIITIP